MRKCYLSKNYKHTNSAGNKAKTDIESIMVQAGYKNLGFSQSKSNNAVIGFVITLLSIAKTFLALRKNDILVLQYPLKKYYKIICRMAHVRGAKTITIIHDLGSFRRQKLTVQDEIKKLELTDFIIAHNKNMTQWLKDNGSTRQITEIEIFDFLSPTENKSSDEHNNPYNVVYAGALNQRKNAFLYKLINTERPYNFSLYGGGFENDAVEHNNMFSYKGFVSHDELITSANGDFGLVWDGNSVDTCSGNFGEYLQYNNPHKTSLYIRCHLPLFVWEKSGMADFIKRNKIGYTINSIKEIDKLLSSISDEEYQKIKENTSTVSKNLSQGYYTKKALSIAEKALS